MFGRRLGQNSSNVNSQQHIFTSSATRVFGGPALTTTPRISGGQRIELTSLGSSKTSLPKPSCEPQPAPEIFSGNHYKRSKPLDNLRDNENDEFDCSVSYF